MLSRASRSVRSLGHATPSRSAVTTDGLQVFKIYAPARRLRQRSDPCLLAESALWKDCRLHQRRLVASATLLRTSEDDDQAQQERSWTEESLPLLEGTFRRELIEEDLEQKDQPESVSELPTTAAVVASSSPRLYTSMNVSEESNSSSSTTLSKSKRRARKSPLFSWPIVWDACKRKSLPDVLRFLNLMEMGQLQCSTPGHWFPFVRFVVGCNYHTIKVEQAELIRNHLLAISDRYFPRKGMTIGVDEQRFIQRLMEALVHMNLFTRALQILTVWTEEGGKSFKLQDAVRALRRLKEWTVIAAITSNDSDFLRFNGREVVETRMMALVEIGQPASAIQTFSAVPQLAQKPTRNMLTLLLRCHLANSDVLAADKVLDTLAKRGENEGVNFIQAMLNGYRSLGVDPQVEQRVLEDILAGKLRYSTSVINSLLQLQVDANDCKSATPLLGYLNLPEQWKQNGPFAVFADSEKPKGDIATFTILINMACRGHKLQRADLEVLWEMLLSTTSTQRPVDALALRALVKGLIASGHSAEAMSVVSDAIRDKPNVWRVGKVKLTAAVFNPLFRHSVAEQGVDGALSVLELMDEASVLPDAITIRTLTVALGFRLRASPLAMAKFSAKMIDALPMITPDSRLLDAVFHQAVDAGTRRHAPQDERHLPESHLASPSGMAAAAASPADVDSEGRQIFDPTAGMQATGPLRLAVAPILNAVTQTGTMSSSSAFTSRLVLEGWSPSSSAFSAETIYNLMLKRGIKPTAAHFLQLMQVFVRKHMPQKAEDLFKMAALVGVEPTVEMWSVLVWGYGETGNVKECHSAVQRMQTLGLRPNQYVYSSIGSALLKTRQYSKAHRFMMSSLAKLKEIDSTTLSIAFHASMRAGCFAEGVQLLRHYKHVPIDKKLRDSMDRTLHTHRNRIKTRWREDTRWVADELEDILKTAVTSASSTEKMGDYVKPLRKALQKIAEQRPNTRISGDWEDIQSRGEHKEKAEPRGKEDRPWEVPQRKEQRHATG